MSENAQGSGGAPRTREPTPVPRRTPRPRTLSPSRGTETSGVGRHSRIIAKRSQVNPAVITIVIIGILGFFGIIAYSAMGSSERTPPKKKAGPPASGLPTAPAPVVAPSASPAATPAPVATTAPAAPPSVRTRRPQPGKISGTISTDGNDSRTFSWSCGCGAAIQAGDATCSGCSSKLEWAESIPCPFCHPPSGSAVCALCQGNESRRMMGIEIRCSLCDGTKKCKRCKGTGKLSLK